MMDRFSRFADDVNTVKRFAGDAKYLYKFGKNVLKGGLEGTKFIYDALFRPHYFSSKLDELVQEYKSKNKEFFVCFKNNVRVKMLG